MAAATDSYLVFEELEPRTGGGPGTPMGKFHVLDFEMNEVSAFREPPPRFQQMLQLSPDGTKAAVWSEAETASSPRLVRVDLATGKAESQVTVTVPFGSVAQVGPGVTAPITGDLLAPVYFSPASQSSSATTAEPVWFQLSWYRPWEGAEVHRGAMPTMWAPGSALYCEEVAMRGETGSTTENWPAVIVRDATGMPTVAIRSAAVYYGDGLGNRRWLADSSAFVAMVDNGATEGAGWSRIGYAVVQADGKKMEMLPAVPNPGTHFPEIPSSRGAIPHPTDTPLMAFGHLDVLDRRTGNWVRANLPADTIPGHVDPWAGRQYELAIVLPHGGHDGAVAPALIAPQVLHPAVNYLDGRPILPEELQMRIKGEGDCLTCAHCRHWTRRRLPAL